MNKKDYREALDFITNMPDLDEVQKELDYMEEFKSQSMYSYYGDIEIIQNLLDYLRGE